MQLRKTISSLALTIAMALGVVSSVHAACLNTVYPHAQVYIERQPDWSLKVQIWEYDNDALYRRALQLFRNGSYVQSSVGGYEAGIMTIILPVGYGTAKFVAGDFDACGNFRQYIPVALFSN